MMNEKKYCYNPRKTRSYNPSGYFQKTNTENHTYDTKHEKAFIVTKKKVAALMLICVLGAGVLSFGGNLAANALISGNESGNTNVTDTGFKLEDATGSKKTVQEISSKAADSIVEIKTESVESDQWIREYVTEGAGSGIIIKSNGYIMTNAHVVSGAQKIYVTNNNKKYEATLVGSDSENDIAILKINANKLSAVTFGNSNQVNVGDLAVVIGNPLGELGDSVSAGIISAKDREVTLDDTTMSLIQTDASVNPGNSGGGMFNQYGQLIGVIVAKSSGTDVEGLGFAIPVNVASKVANSIMNGNGSSDSSKSETAYSGMTYLDLTDDEVASQYNVFQTGIYIKEVSGDEAQAAGFEEGDLVYSMNGTKITSLDQVKKIITSKKPGDTMKYEIVRNNQILKISLKLTSKPS